MLSPYFLWHPNIPHFFNSKNFLFTCSNFDGKDPGDGKYIIIISKNGINCELHSVSKPVTVTDICSFRPIRWESILLALKHKATANVTWVP